MTFQRYIITDLKQKYNGVDLMKIWQDKLKPIQPFFVLNTSCFMQEVYLRQGISHFYSFRIEEEIDLPTVPDGCIDIMFEYCRNEIKAYACGSILKHSTQHWEGDCEIFGVRFMPGIMPAGLNALPKDLINKRVLLVDLIMDRSMIERMAKERDFKHRIKVFLECYTSLEKKAVNPYGKLELCSAVKDLVYESDGLIKISEIAEITGYTARYINKVFIEFMGFSPKVFCKIIQFQRALDVLNYGEIGNMTEVAVKLGYYDQPQFIRDFKTYLGTTPNKYLKMLEEKHYRDCIKEVK